jgi:hypothetical protein
MSSDHPPPVGPPYYNRLPSVFTPLVFRNRGYCVKQDLADWLEVNKKEHIKGSPYKDTVNVYIVYYLQVTLFADPRLPSTAFLRAFGAEVMPTEDPPTTPRFDRLCNKSAALSALNAHSPSVVTRRKAAAAISIEVVVRMFIDSTYKGSWFAQSDLHFWKVPTSSAN